MMLAGAKLGEQLFGKWGNIAGGAGAALISSAGFSAGANIIGKLSFRDRLNGEQNNPELNTNRLRN
jgi:hypothetical protein